MTREEIKKAMCDTKKEVVIKNLHKLLTLIEGYPEYEDCIGYAIEKLEQEPFKPMVEIDLYSVIKQKYIEREVLDKIRAGIEQEYKNEFGSYGQGLRRAIEILDKYKAESEG